MVTFTLQKVLTDIFKTIIEAKTMSCGFIEKTDRFQVCVMFAAGVLLYIR